MNTTPSLTPDEVQGWLNVAAMARKPLVLWQFSAEQMHARALIEARLRNEDRRKVFEARVGADERRKS